MEGENGGKLDLFPRVFILTRFHPRKGNLVAFLSFSRSRVRLRRVASVVALRPGR